MDLTETKMILAYITAAYPKYYANVTKESAERQAVVWRDVLGEYDVNQVKAGVLSYISADSSGFPPSPGQIIENIYFVGNPRDHSGTEEWALVRKAVNVPWDQFEASFATLPKAVQIAIGSQDSLKELAQMDTQRFETVAQSNFLRMYDAAKKREAKEITVPNAVIAAKERIALGLKNREEARRQEALPQKPDSGRLIESKKEEQGGGVEAPADMMAKLRARLGQTTERSNK